MKNISLLFFAIIVSLSACKKDSSDDNNNNPNPNPTDTTDTTTGNYYLKGTMDGTAFDLIENDLTITGFTCCTSVNLGNGTTKVCNCYGIDQSTVKSLSVTISKKLSETLNDNNPDSCFKSLFTIGPVNYGTTGNESGVWLQYHDQVADVYYKTLNGSQTGSTFNISEVTYQNISIGAGTHWIGKIKGTFSCKLYDDNGVAPPLTITGGTFYLAVDENP